MFAGVERVNGDVPMIIDVGYNAHRVNFVIGKQFFVVCISLWDVKTPRHVFETMRPTRAHGD